MKALIQRVKDAHVYVDGETVGSIGAGMLILLGIHGDDTQKDLKWVAGKCARLRIFADDEGKMNRSLLDTNGDALVVSQFTLYGDTRKGNRPSFVASAPPDIAEPMVDLFVRELERLLAKNVETGRFGAMMDVTLTNDGPVTLMIERAPGTT